MSMAEMVRKQASAAIVKYGEKMMLATVVGTTKDTTSGTVTEVYDPQVVCHGVRNSTQQKALGFKFGEGNVRTGDIEISLAAEDGVNPIIGSKIFFDGVSHQIIANQPSVFQGLTVLNSLLVRM
jgi:hypothetical protein